jgi:hypothetical protein
MKLRRLTNSGLEKFNEYLDELTITPSSAPPFYLLESTEYTELAGDPTDVVISAFPTRLAIAEYLDTLFKDANLTPEDRDVGLWAWLALAYFDILCPVGGNGTRKPRERVRYIPKPESYLKYYRHQLLGPYLIYRANRDNPQRAMALLCKAPHIHDDIVEQLASRQELVSNHAIMELATTLYYDSASKQIKKGAAGKRGLVVPRHLADVLSQFDLTWDLYAMTADELLKVLPREFRKFAQS